MPCGRGPGKRKGRQEYYRTHKAEEQARKQRHYQEHREETIKAQLDRYYEVKRLLEFNLAHGFDGLVDKTFAERTKVTK